MNPIRSVVIAALFALAACATGKDVKVEGPQVGKDGQNVPRVSTRAKLLFEEAVKDYEQQKKTRKWDFESLERKFRAAADEDANLAEADFNLGVIAEQKGDKKAATEHYRTALKKKPTLRQAAENLGVLLQNEGRTGEAVEIYQQILATYPDDASSRARLAEIMRQNGDHERALAMAREALMREPKTLPAYKVMMLSYLERQQLSMAKLVALRAQKLDENDPELFHTIGLILLREGERDKALTQFKKAVGARADYQPSHHVLAKLALEDQDYAGAEEHLRRILQADAKNAEAHLNLGVAYKGMGQFDKALAEYGEAEKLKPDLPAIYLNKGVILHRHKDQPEKGIELYRKYLAMGGQGGSDAVMRLLSEAEQVVAAKEEAARAEAEAKRMEAAAKAEAELQKKDGKGPGDAPAQAPKAQAPEAQAPAPEARPAAAKQGGGDEPGGDEPSDNL